MLIVALRLLAVACCLATASVEAQGQGNAITAFAGRMTSNPWEEVVFPHDIDFRASNLLGVASSHRLGTPFEGFDVELEGQVVWHFGRERHRKDAAAGADIRSPRRRDPV